MTDEIEIVDFDPHSRVVEEHVSYERIPEEKQAEYLELIKTVAAGIFSSGNLPPGLEFDDLVGYGYVGLTKAWKNYDNDKGAVFRTYATYRIRGEILDNIRKEWKSKNPNFTRRVDAEKVKAKILDVARSTMLELGGEIEDEDKILQAALSNTAVVYLLSLENMENLSQIVRKEDVSTEIINRFERANERIFLQEAIEELDETEQKIIKMYYYENVTQLDIANHLNISKSKVSRVHMKVLERLKRKIALKLDKDWSI